MTLAKAMSYRFKSDEALADGLKRIFREEIKAALKETRRPVQKRGEAVHEFRKHLKKLRAALCLAADEVGQDRHKKADRYVRDIAKVVSDLRDAHVRLQTIRFSCTRRFRARAFEKIFRRIEELLDAGSGKFFRGDGRLGKTSGSKVADSREASRAVAVSRTSVGNRSAAPWRCLIGEGGRRLAEALKDPTRRQFPSLAQGG